jgi:hypothetical protein
MTVITLGVGAWEVFDEVGCFLGAWECLGLQLPRLLTEMTCDTYVCDV